MKLCKKRKQMSELARRNIANGKLGDKNPQWRGDKVGYHALHARLNRYLKKPLGCQNCGKERKLELANISQEYKTESSDWEWLCRRCHMIKDGRMKILIKIHRGVFHKKMC